MAKEKKIRSGNSSVSLSFINITISENPAMDPQPVLSVISTYVSLSGLQQTPMTLCFSIKWVSNWTGSVTG